MMMTREDSASIAPQAIIELFCRAFVYIYGREPAVRYMGNHWYVVDGETVHRKTLMLETHRLQEMATTRAVETMRITSEMMRPVEPVRTAETVHSVDAMRSAEFERNLEFVRSVTPMPTLEGLRFAEAAAGLGGGTYNQESTPRRSHKSTAEVLRFAEATDDRGGGGGTYSQESITTRAPKVEKGVLHRLIARLRNL